MPGTTPVYGFPYPEPTDLVADYPALGQQHAEAIEDVLPTIVGLVNITPTSIANTGGTATLSGSTVTVSGASSVSLNGVFTTNYYAYLVVVTDFSGSGNPAFRMRASGTDATTNYVSRGYQTADVAFQAHRINGGTSFDTGNSLGAVPSSLYLRITDAAQAGQTRVAYESFTAFSNTSASTVAALGVHNTAGAYDGITIFATSYGGKINVYGMGK